MNAMLQSAKPLSTEKEHWGQVHESITHRSKFYEEYEIKQILKQEMDENPSLFGTVPQKWKAPKVFIKEEDIKNVQNIITEGYRVDQYNKKMEVARKYIDIMNIYR